MCQDGGQDGRHNLTNQDTSISFYKSLRSFSPLLWDKRCNSTGYLVQPQQRTRFFKLESDLYIDKLEHGSLWVKEHVFGRNSTTLLVCKIKILSLGCSSGLIMSSLSSGGSFDRGRDRSR